MNPTPHQTQVFTGAPPPEAWDKQVVPDAGSRRIFDRFALISREELLALARIDSARTLALVALDLAVIAGVALLVEGYWSIWLYCVAVMVIGARQIGLMTVGIHDGAHGLLFRNRQLNDRFARLLTEPLFVAVLDMKLARYRKSHFEHHRHTNDHHDPDAGIYDRWYEMSPARRAFFLCLALSGIFFVLQAYNRLYFACWRTRVLVMLGVVALVAGVVFSVYPAHLVLLYWIVPYATWGMLVHIVQTVSEHYPSALCRQTADNPPEILRTRDVMLSWFDALFVTTRAVNFHLTHHLFPAVPFFRLKSLHRIISTREAYRENAHVTYGYHRVLLEIFNRGPAETK